MATIYHEYGPGDETYICPQRRQIRQDSVELRETVRRLSESEVRRTTEKRRKSEVIDEKASVLGSVQSMREGKLPSNKQLSKAINKLLSSKSIETNKHNMSADGQLLLKDFQELLLIFQHALQTKNRDELFQSMIYHVKKSEASLGDIKPSIEGDAQQKEQAKGDAKTGAGAILKVAKLFLFNAQFKGILEQILNIAEQTMGGVLQESGKVLDNHANSETNPVNDDNNNSLGNKIRNTASKMANVNDQDPSDDQSTMKDKVRNAAAGIAGGAAVGGGASHLASNHHDEDSSNSNQHPQSRDMGSQSKEMNSHLPKDYQNFLEHRFVDSESSAPATDDAGHTFDQDIEHGAVSHSNDFISAGQLFKMKRPQQVQSQSSKSNSSASPINEQVFLNNESATQPAATERSRDIGAPTVPQHQMFMANSSAVQPTATESTGGMPKQASAIPSSTSNELQRSESPSSFTDTGKVGSNNQEDFKHEQFYGNHMGVYDSNLNKPKPSSSGKATDIASAGIGATAASLGMAGYLHKKQNVSNESPSSLPETGAVGNIDHGEFNPEHFYDNQMGVEDSGMNQPKPMENNKNQGLSHQKEQYYSNNKSIPQPRQTSHSSGALYSDNGDSNMRQKLNASVPKYAAGAKSASDEYIQTRFDSPSGGGNSFLHQRLNAAVPHSFNADQNPQSLSPISMDSEQRQQQQQQQQQQRYPQSNKAPPEMNDGTQEDYKEFLHKPLHRQSIPLTNNQTLYPKSHISAGAGYDLKQDDHTVPSKEIVELLRRPNATGNGSHVEDQVKAHAHSFSGQHVMDKLDYTTDSGGALVNPQQQQDTQTRQLPNPIQDHENDFPGDHVMDRIDDSRNQTTTPTTGQSRNIGIGAAVAGAGAGGATILGNRQQNQAEIKDPQLTNKFNTASHVADYNADYLNKDIPSIEPDASTHSAIPDKTATNSHPKRNSFNENHMYQGVDGQRHMDDGSNTKPIISNREAVRRMSSGENIDLAAHPTKPGSGIGPASALGAGASTGAAAAAATTSNREQQTQDDKTQTSSDLPNKDTRISANKVVNKMKQQTGTDGEVAKDEDEQDSISANEIISKLKEILITVQKNPEYQEAMSTLMSLFSTWGNRLKTGQMDRRRSSAVPVPEQKEYYKSTAAHEAKTIIEDWAQGRSLDPVLRQFSEVSNKLKQDDTLKNLMKKIIAYVQKMLQEPGYLSGNESTEDGSKLVEEVRHSALEEYKPQVKSMIKESSVIVKSVSDDPVSQKVSEKVKAIHDHLWYDSYGHAAFKPHLLNDMRISLIPALIEQIKYVPLPQIIYSDNQFEIAIENMVLQGDTLMPDIFEVKADDYLRFSPKANVSFTNSQSIHVHMTGIQTTMEDVVFYYRRKSGFPKVSDSGVVALSTGGAGLRVSLRVVSSSVDQRHTFRIDQCHCHMDKLNIKVNHSKHNTLYKVLNPMMTGIIKRQMCKAIENKLIASFEQGDAKITKHIIDKKLSEETTIKDARRPGLFSHLVKILNQKVSAI